MYSPNRQPETSPELQGLLNRKQAAKYLKVTVRTMHKWAQTHPDRPRFRKYANVAFYLKEDLDQFIKDELDRFDSAKQAAKSELGESFESLEKQGFYCSKCVFSGRGVLLNACADHS